MAGVALQHGSPGNHDVDLVGTGRPGPLDERDDVVDRVLAAGEVDDRRDAQTRTGCGPPTQRSTNSGHTQTAAVPCTMARSHRASMPSGE